MAISTQLLKDAENGTLIKLTNDAGTGETSVLKVDPSTLLNTDGNGTYRIEISEITYCINGGSVNLLWDATVNIPAVVLSGTGRFVDNIPNIAGAGITGNILLSTIGFVANSTYTIFLRVRKTTGFIKTV